MADDWITTARRGSNRKVGSILISSAPVFLFTYLLAYDFTFDARLLHLHSFAYAAVAANFVVGVCCTYLGSQVLSL